MVVAVELDQFHCRRSAVVRCGGSCVVEADEHELLGSDEHVDGPVV
jgi:hypothetical protein